MRPLRLKWRLETLAEGGWHKLTCNPVPRMEHFATRMEKVISDFEDMAQDDFMVHYQDRDYCTMFAVKSEIDAVSLQLLLPVSGCYRGLVKLRREQRQALERRATQ